MTGTIVWQLLQMAKGQHQLGVGGGPSEMCNLPFEHSTALKEEGFERKKRPEGQQHVGSACWLQNPMNEINQSFISGMPWNYQLLGQERVLELPLMEPYNG